MLNKDSKKGLLFIISAPAGTGKTTLTDMLVKEFSNVVQSISFTTRSPRLGEINGVHYNFVSRPDFEKKINEDEFLEYVELYGTYYGTSSKWVEEKQDLSKDVVLVIDTQGCQKVRKKREVVSIFIKPPSMDVLRERLTSRRTETDAVIEKRLDCAAREITDGNQYDYIIINDKLDEAYAALKSIYIAEQHRNRKS